MKRLKILALLMIFLICVSFITLLTKINFASAETNQFARVKFEQCYFYKTPTENYSFDNVHFLLPITYFVKLTANENEIFYKAEYLNIQGFVKKTDVQCVSGTPAYPYLNQISFRVFAQNGLYLRSQPTDENGLFNQIIAVPYLNKNLMYYGKIEGSEAVPGRSNIWYYCKYGSNQQVYYGYLYSGYCDMLSKISDNTEILSIIDAPIFLKDFEKTTSSSNIQTLNSLNSTTQVLIICGVSIPALFIIYLLFKPNKMIAKSVKEGTNKSAQKRKRKQKGDYYEYED